VPTWVAPVKTPVTPVQAATGNRNALRRYVAKPQASTISILHGHQALETGNYDQCIDYAVGHVKATNSWSKLYTTIKLNEYLQRDGKRVLVWFDPTGELLSKDGPVRPGTAYSNPPGHPQTWMRAYEKLEEALEDKLDVLFRRYKAAFDRALAGDVEGYVRGLHQGGYFTANFDPYLRGVSRLSAKYLPVAMGVLETPLYPVEDDQALCNDMAECMRVELPDWLKAKVRVQQAEHVDDALEQARKARDEAIREENQ
jgi:hypothetical protein